MIIRPDLQKRHDVSPLLVSLVVDVTNNGAETVLYFLNIDRYLGICTFHVVAVRGAILAVAVVPDVLGGYLYLIIISAVLHDRVRSRGRPII